MPDQRDDESGDLYIADIMEAVPGVVTIGPEASLHDLIELMQKERIGGLPVVEADGRLVGIVTEGDIVAEDAELKLPNFLQFRLDFHPFRSKEKFEEQLRKMVGVTVGDIMTTEVLTVNADDEIEEAASRMIEHNINRVPVVDDDGRLTGVVTRMDIIRTLGL